MGRSTDDRTLSTADRRRFLTVLGALGVTGLAGCGGDGDGTDSPTDTETGGNGNGNGNGNGEMTPTDTDMGGNGETPTETETPTDVPEQPLGDSPDKLLEIGGGSLQPGGTTTLSGTLENRYLFAVQNVEVTMTAPNDDWTVEATGETSFDSIPSGGTEDVGWNVTAPDDADGEFTVEGSVTYETTTDSADISLPVSVIVLNLDDAPQEGLQVYYPFDSDPPTDASGNGNDPDSDGGTLPTGGTYNAPEFLSSGGVFEGAYDFDESNNEAMTFPDVSNVGNFRGSSAYTTSLWIYLDTYPSVAYTTLYPVNQAATNIRVDGTTSDVTGNEEIVLVNFDGNGCETPDRVLGSHRGGL
jgi:hypothetical protein